MSYKTISRVQDYTDAFLTTLGIFLFMSFWVIAAAFGYLWVALTAYGLDQCIRWIGRRNSR